VTGSVARIAGGAGIVACAAIVAFAAGGGSVFGGLGGLFGSPGKSLQVAGADAPAADIVAAPPIATSAVALGHGLVTPRGGGRRVRAAHPKHSPRTTPPSPLPVLQPAPNPVPPSPVPAPPPPGPSPGSGQVTHTVGDTVKQVTSQAPPPLQPVTQQVNNTVDTLEQACSGLPVCP
jgi:hypothetical protein